MLRLRVLLLSCLLIMAAAVSVADDEITPAHVYQGVAQLNADIGLVRAVMGKPVLTIDPWIVEDALPRHVYYQAQTMFRKANQLATEYGGSDRMSPTPAPEGEIEPDQVFALVKDAQAQIDSVRRALGIALRADAPELESRREPRDVLQAIVQASRQLNLMLNRQFEPEDVYARLVLASTYVAGALTKDVNEPQYGTLPALEPARLPSDVYRRVLECLELTTSIGEQRGIEVLKLNLRKELRRKDISPADVYDVATTVLSELAFVTAGSVNVEPQVLEKPQYVFPSHVYQIAGMLQDQLARLEALN